MKISFKNFKFGKGFLSISLDNGKNFQNVNVSDIEKSGFLLSDDQDLSAVKIKGPSGLLKSLDVISNVKIQNNDEIVFTYLKNISKFDYVKVPESGYLLDSINIPATSSTMIYLSDNEGNIYKLNDSLYKGTAYEYDELKTHYKELMGKDNLKLELVFRNEITDESGNVTYEEVKRVSLKNKIVIREYEADSYYSFCNVAAKDLSILQTLHILSPSIETYTMITSKSTVIAAPQTLKELNIIKDTSIIFGNIFIYYFGSLSEFDNISLNISLGSTLFNNPKIFVYDRYNNKKQLA